MRSVNQNQETPHRQIWMIEVRMTDKELILNFVSQYDRPFNAELIAKLMHIPK